MRPPALASSIKSRSGALVGCLCAVSFATFKLLASAPAAQQSQALVFKGRLDLVRTEVAVIDNRTGLAVAGLQEQDFSISENGARQKITTFVDQSTLSNQGSVPDADNRRVFLFVFDVGANTGPYNVHDGVAQFIRTKLAPGDIVGVMAHTRLTALTTDHERVAAVVDRLKRTAQLGDALAQIRRTDSREQERIRVIDDFLEPHGAPGFLRDAAAFVLGTSAYRQNDAADTVRNWRFKLAINGPVKVVAGIEALRRVSGRKHLVFVTQFGFYFPIRIRNEGVGLRFESADDDRRLAQQANEAGVAIDIIQTNEYIGSVLSHAIVAEQSGGQFSSLRVAQQQLARVDEGTRNGYVIGYVPANPKLDNQYRNVAVTVNRKNVTVTYRRGYRATENPGSIDPQEVYTRSRMREAVTGNIDLTDLPVRAQAVLATESGRKVVKFSITIDIQALELVDSGGRRTGELDLLVVVGDAQKNVIGKLDQHMTLAMPPALYQQARESGVPYTASVPVTGIPTIARIVAYHFDSDRLGTATVSVR